MKISELVKALQSYQEKKGDCDVKCPFWERGVYESVDGVTDTDVMGHDGELDFIIIES